jgi:hydrogenase maturation protein HypF
VNNIATIDDCERLKVAVRGAVQGVGFRPFVFRLAAELHLYGWVNNSPQGVFLEAEGSRAALEQFLLRLARDKPPRSFIQSLESSWLDAVGYTEFEIRASVIGGDTTALILPDIATCPDCLHEIFDPANRRHRYPFTNCTNCGPRFSIIEALPYDRVNTSMASFKLCPACQAEYDNPLDRRFHAQPNGCPVCGPQLEMWPTGAATWPQLGRSRNGDFEPPRRLAHQHDALLAAAHVIRCGQIVAVKGIGGFHLMVDARNESAVRVLRERKQREEKPFALMFPSLESVQAVCEVSPLEKRLLHSPEAPIVLLKRLVRPHHSPLPLERGDGSAVLGESAHAPFLELPQTRSNKAETMRSANGFKGGADSCSLSPGERARGRTTVEQTHFDIAASVAPGNPNLGVMLPSNPIHHLLMAELGFPVVATSGNLNDEPICTDNQEALERLSGIADVFLVHNRPIIRHIDDSIVRVMLDREMVLRRARGYAPLPIQIRSVECGARTVLAVGAHLKNAVALSVGEQVFMSQHIGDLETEPANSAFRRVAADLPRLYDAQPEVIAADLHPDYLSTQFALERGRSSGLSRLGPPEGGTPNEEPQVIHVQHHIAHVLSCMEENEVELPALGVAWDGTGFGLDRTIWGGEFFRVTTESAERIAHLRPFRLPGGDAAVKEPRRAALGLLHELAASNQGLWSQLRQTVGAAFAPVEFATLEAMLERNINSPRCSSIGRLFDAVASLVDLRQQMRFEGQAAMELEFAVEGADTDESYSIPLVPLPASLLLDWSPMIQALLADVKCGVPIRTIAAKFHNSLAEAILAVAKESGERRVVLSGGCFQNRYLTERTILRLRAEGFQPYWHQRVPPNDGGIALGQIAAARREQAKRGAAFTPHQRPKDNPLLVAEDPVLKTLKRAEAHAPLRLVPQPATL